MRFDEFWEEEDGIGTVEMVLILVVIIGLVILFKNTILNLVKDTLTNIKNDSTEVKITEKEVK